MNPTTYSRAGEGVLENRVLAWWLLREAAARGHPGAQTEVGLRLATGALPSPDRSAALALQAPRWREAAVYLYFGAAGNDTLAQARRWEASRRGPLPELVCWLQCGFNISMAL